MNYFFSNNQSDIEFDEKLEDFIKNICQGVLDHEQLGDVDFDISVTLTDDKEIRKLNSEFRNIDRATDVLSFPMLDFDEEVELFDDVEYSLGDIVISTETAIRQAREYGHSIDREMAFLLCHSMLHLLGYDHIEEDDERQMNELQEEILSKMGISR